MSNFRFSEAERAAVAKALEIDVDHPDCFHVQQIVGEWAELDDDQLRQELARNRRIKKAAEELLCLLQSNTVATDDQCDPFDDEGLPQTLEGHLMVSLHFLDDVEKEYPTRTGRRPQIPARLSARLIEFWERSGRQVGRSSTRRSDEPDRQDASGPLVRFLMAASAPVLDESAAPDAAASAIRTWRNQVPY